MFSIAEACQEEDSAILKQREGIHPVEALKLDGLSTANEAKTEESPSITSENSDDAALIQKAEENYKEEKLFLAARLLRQVQDTSLLQDVHHEIMKNATLGEAVVADLISPPEDGWTKHGEAHGGHRDSVLYYKIDERLQLKCRLESPIESSLLVPLMSVFNESELYETWMPRWHIPFKMGVRRSLKLLQQGRCHQVIQVTTDLPWPLAAREIVISAMAMDNIDEDKNVAVKMTTLSSGEAHGGVEIPTAEKGIVRMDFDGGVLFRECPLDHPALAHSKTEYPKDQHLLLCSLTMHVDAKVTFVPLKFINFVTRTAIGRMWHMLLHVAEEVRDGKRPQHAEAIAKKKDLYDWIEARIEVMFAKLAEEKARATSLEEENATDSVVEVRATGALAVDNASESATEESTTQRS